MALLEALDVPQKANCTARECVEAMLAIEQKLVKDLRNDTAQEGEFLPTALPFVKSD
jgi:hypothetical protein